MSSSLGYYGRCRCCGQERKLYWVGSPTSLQRDMEFGIDYVNESAYQKHLNCMHCFTKHQVRGSVKYLTKMSGQQVRRDLDKASEGFYMDFDAFDEQFANERKMDEQLANDRARVAEYNAWKNK